MPLNRRELLNSIYNVLITQNVLAADEIDTGAREGVMQEEQRSLPAFFNPGGIYDRLLTKYPAFSEASSAKEAEDAAIKDLVQEIERRLSVATDRLTGHVVGLDAAKEAVARPEMRRRREYQCSAKPTERTFDEIGQLHSALRLIFSDDTHHPSSAWRSPYLNGDISFKGHSYRHYLALIWKGATEEEIEAPVTHIGIQNRELRDMGVRQIIASLAQCRREHNFDGSKPDWDQSASPQDAQRCDNGLRGDLFGQMLLHNEHYMQTRTILNVELIEPMIRDIIFEIYAAQDDTNKINIVSYLNSKSMIIDPEPDEVEAMEAFVLLVVQTGRDLLIKRISAVDPTSPFYKIKECITNMERKFTEEDEAAIRAYSCLMEYIQDYVRLEANSLLLSDDTNLADMDFLRRFATEGISTAYQQRLRHVLKENSRDIARCKKQHQGFINKVHGLAYIVDSDLIRAAAFTEAPFLEQRKRRLEMLIDHYMLGLNAMKSETQKMIDSFADRSAVDQQFGLAADAGVDAVLEARKEAFVKAQQTIVIECERLIRMLDNIRTRLEPPNRNAWGNVRPYIQRLAFTIPPESKTTHFYVKYIWALLTEKTPAGHCICSNTENNELRAVLDLIFGDETKGLVGLDKNIQDLIIYGLNNDKVTLKNAHEDVGAQVEILTRYLTTKGIDLSKAQYRPSRQKVKLIEAAYVASKETTHRWKSIIERSGTREALISFVNAPPDECSRIMQSPELLINVATNLPISYNTESKCTLNRERQATASQVWSAIARSICEELGNNDGPTMLLNFVIQTLMAHLQITEFIREDTIVIDQIIRTYLGIKKQDDKFLLPFDTDSVERGSNGRPKLDGCINLLRKHLSILLTTLSHPTIKGAFEVGLVRLCSRERAIWMTGATHYVVRLSNRDPNHIVISGYGGHVYPKADVNISIEVDGRNFIFGKFENAELNLKITSIVGGKIPIQVAPVEDDETTKFTPQTALAVLGSGDYQKSRNQSYLLSSTALFSRAAPAAHPAPNFREGLTDIGDQLAKSDTSSSVGPAASAAGGSLSSAASGFMHSAAAGASTMSMFPPRLVVPHPAPEQLPPTPTPPSFGP